MNIPKQRYAVGTQLSKEEREMLDNMLSIEREKIKRAFPDLEPEKLINDSSFVRDLIKKEYNRRKIMNKKSKVS